MNYGHIPVPGEVVCRCEFVRFYQDVVDGAVAVGVETSAGTLRSYTILSLLVDDFLLAVRAPPSILLPARTSGEIRGL